MYQKRPSTRPTLHVDVQRGGQTSPFHGVALPDAAGVDRYGSAAGAPGTGGSNHARKRQTCE